MCVFQIKTLLLASDDLGGTVLTAAVDSKEPAMVKKVVECVRRFFPDGEVIKTSEGTDFALLFIRCWVKSIIETFLTVGVPWVWS